MERGILKTNVLKAIRFFSGNPRNPQIKNTTGLPETPKPPNVQTHNPITPQTPVFFETSQSEESQYRILTWNELERFRSLSEQITRRMSSEKIQVNGDGTKTCYLIRSASAIDLPRTYIAIAAKGETDPKKWFSEHIETQQHGFYVLIVAKGKQVLFDLPKVGSNEENFARITETRGDYRNYNINQLDVLRALIASTTIQTVDSGFFRDCFKTDFILQLRRMQNGKIDRVLEAEALNSFYQSPVSGFFNGEVLSTITEFNDWMQPRRLRKNEPALKK